MDFETFMEKWRCQTFRFENSKAALKIAHERGAKIFVETGTMQRRVNTGHARSTVLYADFVKTFGGHFTTIDLMEAKIKRVRGHTKFAASQMTYVVSDAVQALKKIEGPIDFLYLDSLGWDRAKPMVSTKYQIKELKAVENNIHVNTVILLDDNFKTYGRTILSVPYLQELGWVVISQGHQVALVHKDSEFEFDAEAAWKVHECQGVKGASEKPHVSKDWYVDEKAAKV